MSKIKEDRLYAFKRKWDNDLADLYYYSISFDNMDQAKSIAIDWKKKYKDITSLFYYEEEYDEPSSVNFVPFYILNHRETLKISKFTPKHFNFLIKLGLKVKNYDLFLFSAVKENNLVFWNYFYTQHINNLTLGESHRPKGRSFTD